MQVGAVAIPSDKILHFAHDNWTIHLKARVSCMAPMVTTTLSVGNNLEEPKIMLNELTNESWKGRGQTTHTTTNSWKCLHRAPERTISDIY